VGFTTGYNAEAGFRASVAQSSKVPGGVWKGLRRMQAWRLGAYELVRRLGEGGMAQVYLARDVRLGREVAVKVLDARLAERPGFRERFLREARVAAALDHPNIVPLYDFGDTEHLLYLVMPYVSGGSLQDMLRRTPLPAGEVVTYASQMTDALDYAHKRGVVHRDVKPANMLLHADGRLMLTDFGLAKILGPNSRPAVPRGHPDAGTPEYMAPEQIEGRTDERSDIYALGVVLYLLLTGHLPFTGSTSSAVMEGHLYRLPEDPRTLNPAITPAMQTVIARALAKHSEDRYQKAGELGAALLGALVAGDAQPLPFVFGSSEPPAPPSIPYRPPSASSGPMAKPWGPSRATGGMARQSGVDILSALPNLGPLPAPRSQQPPPMTSGIYSPAAPINTIGRMPVAAPSPRPLADPMGLPLSSPRSLPTGMGEDPQFAPPFSSPISNLSGSMPLPRVRALRPTVTPRRSGQRLWILLAVAFLLVILVAVLLLHGAQQQVHGSGSLPTAAQLAIARMLPPAPGMLSMRR
jgi:serine/threonine protein kinase